jgi:hypothetical protein
VGALDSGTEESVVMGCMGGRHLEQKSACPGNGIVDWRSWEGGSPEDRLLLFTEAGNPRRASCKQERRSLVSEDALRRLDEDP